MKKNIVLLSVAAIMAFASSASSLKNYIEYVQKCADIKTDRGFQTFIQNKFLETVKNISLMNLPSNDLTLQYIENNKIREVDDGFILYNDTIVETESEGYNGKFSIALAFCLRYSYRCKTRQPCT